MNFSKKQLSEKLIFFGKKYLNSKTTPIPCGSRGFSWSIVHKSNWNDLRMSVSASNMHDFWIKSALFHQRSKKSLLENFREEKTLQSILSSEMLIICNKKRHELSSEGKYSTLTIKTLKTRYIALKKRYKKARSFWPCFFTLISNQIKREHILSLYIICLRFYFSRNLSF